MRVCWRVRTLMVGVALSAATLGVFAGIQRRGESFRRLAAYHLQASDLLFDQAGGPLECSTGMTEKDVENIFCKRGPKACRAYRAAMYHEGLWERYKRAAERPWLIVVADPPAPPGANPKLEVSQAYYNLVSEEEPAAGFK